MRRPRSTCPASRKQTKIVALWTAKFRQCQRLHVAIHHANIRRCVAVPQCRGVIRLPRPGRRWRPDGIPPHRIVRTGKRGIPDQPGMRWVFYLLKVGGAVIAANRVGRVRVFKQRPLRHPIAAIGRGSGLRCRTRPDPISAGFSRGRRQAPYPTTSRCHHPGEATAPCCHSRRK